MDDLLTDHDDPEKRIAALEHGDGAAASRRFVASAAAPSTKQMMKYTYLLMFGAMAALGLVNMALFLIGALVGTQLFVQVGGPLVFIAFLLGAMPAFGAFRRRMNREKTVLVDVGRGGLTVSTKPGDVFSFGDAQLGRWTLEGYGALDKGTALHLRSGAHRFVLGGRDHRATTEKPLAAPPVDSVDASMPASKFDELLALVGGPRRPEAPGPTPGQPTRCALTPNPARMFSSSFFGMFKNTATALRLNATPPQPSVAIDVGGDEVSVIDAKSNARIASAPLAQVTATPAASTRSIPRMGVLTMAVLVVRVPNSEPLTIGCPDWAGPPGATWSGSTTLTYRFAWRGEVPAADEPEFVVSDVDWLTLVEKFGLAPRLEDRALQGGEAAAPGGAPLARPKRKLWIYGVVIAGALFIVAPAMMLVAGKITNSHQRQADQVKAERERPFALPFTDLRVPHGVAVDAAGNVYISDSHTNRVSKLAAGSNTQTVLPFTGLDLCPNNIEAATAGVAVDAAGAVYVADSCHNRVLKLAAGSSTQTELPFRGLDFPEGVAVDSAGAVYAVDHSGGRILKLPAGASTQTVLPKPGKPAPSGNVAVDPAGNVYISCSRGRSRLSCLMRLAPGSDAWTRLPSDLDNSGDTFSSGEQDVAADAAGNVYMIASRVVMKLAPGSDTWTQLQGAPPLVDPCGLAVDTRGNVYVTDHLGSRATGEGLPWEQDDAVGFVLKLPAG